MMKISHFLLSVIIQPLKNLKDVFYPYENTLIFFLMYIDWYIKTPFEKCLTCRLKQDFVFPRSNSMFPHSQFSVSMRKTCAINHILCLMISLCLLRFHPNAHLYLISFTSSDVWTIGPKTCRFVYEFNIVCISYFHFDQLFL